MAHFILISLSQSNDQKIYLTKGILFTIFALFFLQTNTNNFKFIQTFFLAGIISTTLATVPIFHWLNVVKLENNQIDRFGNDEKPELNPISFGYFGFTEAFPDPNSKLGIPRLQGFAIEPISWSYIINMFIINSCLYAAYVKKRLFKILNYVFLLFLFAHLHFVLSMVGLVVFYYWIFCISFAQICFKSFSIKKNFYFLFATLIPGILAPLIFYSISNLDVILNTENILGKESNWDSKIKFLNYKLFDFINPLTLNNQGTSHNLLLDSLLRYGFLYSLVLYLFFWVLINSHKGEYNLLLYAAIILFILNNTIVCPPFFYSAAGSISLLLIVNLASNTFFLRKKNCD